MMRVEGGGGVFFFADREDAVSEWAFACVSLARRLINMAG
jgi:hypothetical protein